ncbi:MAG: hypothetical protein WCI53_11875 [Bacteroidota bacterium]|jgi:hypothetical protein
MARIRNKSALILSGIITILSVIASAGGLFVKNVYNDNAFVKSAWYSNDLVTLFIVVPMLIIAIFKTYKGDIKWQLILMGLLAYIFYNFAFYLFGATFNIFFLVYSSLLTLSACSLVLLISKLKPAAISSYFSAKIPVKWISGYLIFTAILLMIIEMSMILPYLTSSTIPETIILTGKSTSIVFALDFSIIIPVSLIAAMLLWQKKAWGFLLSSIMLVKGIAYGLVLCIGTISLAYSSVYGKWDPLFPLYIGLVILGLFFCWLLLKN